VKRFLANGGQTLLLGETREEYLARDMSAERKAAETRDDFIDTVDIAESLAGEIIVAVDQEIGGISRLHALVPPFFSTGDWRSAEPETIKAEAFAFGEAAWQLGINCILGPVLDVVTGDNPWLFGRTVSTDPAIVTHVSTAFIRGVQAAGVAATAKHFPGHHHIPLDPAENEAASVTGDAGSFETGFGPFEDAIANGVEAMMVGPALVEAFDKCNPASLSPNVINLLRGRFGFRGLVVSDGLDAPATSKGRSISDVSVDGLKAGCDLVLLAAGDHLDHVVESIFQAVERGDLEEMRLAEAASRVRAVASKYSRTRSAL